MANPDFDRIFAEGGTKDTIIDADYDGGWDDIAGALPPTKEEFNAIDNEQDVKLKWLYDRMTRAIAATGTDTYTAAGIVDQIDGQIYTVLFANTNTGASTLNGKDIVNRLGIALAAGDISAIGETSLRYDLANDRFVHDTAILRTLAYRAGLKSIANNTPTEMNYNIESIDTAGSHDTSTLNTRFTTPAGCTKLRFSAQIVFDGDAGDFFRAVSPLLNGVSIDYAPRFNLSGVYVLDVFMPITSGWIDVEAGDYLEFSVLHTKGSALSVLGDANQTFVNVEFQ